MGMELGSIYIYNKNVDENLKNKKERKNDDEKSVISFFPNNRREENISSSWEKSEY